MPVCRQVYPIRYELMAMYLKLYGCRYLDIYMVYIMCIQYYIHSYYLPPCTYAVGTYLRYIDVCMHVSRQT